LAFEVWLGAECGWWRFGVGGCRYTFKSLEQLEKHDSLNTLKKHGSTGFALRCYPVGHDPRFPCLTLHDRWLSLPTIEQMMNKADSVERQVQIDVLQLV